MDSLFGSDTLEVSIGLALFFLLVSLICTAAREAIEGLLKRRAIDLERGLRELLNDADGRGVMKDLFAHPMIYGLFGGEYDPGGLRPKNRLSVLARQWWRKLLKLPAVADHGPMVMRPAMARHLPSYIPAAQFATALIDLVARGPATASPLAAPSGVVPATASLTVAGLRQAAAAFPNPAVQRVIITGLDAAGDDLEALKKHLEDWFNGTMDRVSGWYKRRTQHALLWIGIIAAVALNLDALTVLSHLGTDEKLRANAVAAAEKQIKAVASAGAAPATAAEAGAPAPPPVNETAEEKQKRLAAEQAKADEQAAKDEQKAREQIDSLRKQLGEIGYPIGWRDNVPGPQSTLCARVGKGPKGVPGRPARIAADSDDPKCVGGLRVLVPLESMEWVTLTPGGETLCAKPGYTPVAGAVKTAEACKRGPRRAAADYVRVLPWSSLLTIPLGWLVTALAVMLGAPFWFDILNKFMIVRATVKPTEKSPDEPSPDAKKDTAAAQAAQAAVAGAAPVHHLDPGAGGAPQEPPFTPHQWNAGDPDKGDL